MLAFAYPTHNFPAVPSFCLNPDSEHDAAAKPPSDLPTAEEIVSRESDDACARRARDGDRQAMEELVLRHHAEVSRLLWRFARNRTDLEDLVQDTFLRMVRRLPDWRAEQPFIHWLLRIATNVGRDYFRRQSVRRRWMIEPLGNADEAPPEAIEAGADPAARAAASEVKSILAELSPDDRTLLTLHHLEGWGLAQIAAQFGWTLTATKLRAWRARRRLRALLHSRELS